jgi:hypothetical protein
MTAENESTVQHKLQAIEQQEKEANQKLLAKENRVTKTKAALYTAKAVAEVVVGAMSIDPISIASAAISGIQNVHKTLSHSKNRNEEKSQIVTKEHAEVVGPLILNSLSQNTRDTIIAEAGKIPDKVGKKLISKATKSELKITEVDKTCQDYCPKMKRMIEQAVTELPPDVLSKVSKHYIKRADKSAVILEVLEQAQSMRKSLDDLQQNKNYNPFPAKKESKSKNIR